MRKMMLMGTLFLAGATTFTACSKDEEDNKKETPTVEVNERDLAANLDYTKENASSWANYAAYVAQLLVKDAQDLDDAWNKSFKGGEAYAVSMKKHDGVAFKSAQGAVEQIIDGCIDIANEVGEAKIGDPLSKWLDGKKTEALYAVESWYSWHSRDDYTNNIYSIRNAFYGNLTGEVVHNMEANPSILGFIATKGNFELVKKANQAILNAVKAIQAIPQPFRNNIGSQEAKAAQDACAELHEILDKEVKPFITANNTDTDEALYDKIVANYVDNVVLPTYKELAAATVDLKAKVDVLKTAPSNAAFKAAADSWIAARKPWETSEAFLFGPVADLGLDPNMDSWPLDQLGIVNILKSGKFDALHWTGEFDEENEKISAAQNLRGFHTLEFLLFKDGKPRVVK